MSQNLHVGTRVSVEILPSPALFRVNFRHQILHGLENGALKGDSHNAIVAIDDATGTFTAQSGQMDFAYIWPPNRRECDLFTFLASLDFDYFMDKACLSPWRIFDLERTIEFHRNEIRNSRRGQRKISDVTAEIAKARWDALDSLEKSHPIDEANFMLSWERHPALREWSIDYPPSTYTKIAHPAQAFWDDIWTTLIQSPQFRSHMRLKTAA